MILAANTAIDQAQIAKLIDHWSQATRTKDVDARISIRQERQSL